MLGIENAISFDMGGTTAKASLIEHGTIARGREYEVGGSISAGSRLIRGAGELLRIPTIDIAEVGAGGGSIAWLDPAGGLQVGPRSAGADPGPACYGRGGVEPTVTDANVVLGFIPAGEVADGQITIRRELAEEAVERVATPLGLTLLEAADGIHRIANARMTRALRSVSSEKGRDPRDFALIAYGGSGPVHAGGLADELGATTILVPPVAGLFSAVGLLFARPEFHEVRSCHLDVDAVDPGRGRGAARGDGGRARWARSRAAPHRRGPAPPTSATAARAGRSRSSFHRAPVDRQLLATLRERFEDEHELLYGVRGRARLAGRGAGRPARRARRLGRARRPSTWPTRSCASGRPTRSMWLGGEVGGRAGAVARVDRRRAGAGAAARRRVRHDRRRPGRLERAAAREHRRRSCSSGRRVAELRERHRDRSRPIR